MFLATTLGKRAFREPGNQALPSVQVMTLDKLGILPSIQALPSVRAVTLGKLGTLPSVQAMTLGKLCTLPSVHTRTLDKLSTLPSALARTLSKLRNVILKKLSLLSVVLQTLGKPSNAVWATFVC
jgi:hypothetical protein